MRNLNNVLIVVNREEDSRLVLEKVARLAEASGARVHVIRVIYDELVDTRLPGLDDPHQIKTFVMQAEEEYLESLLDGFRDRFSTIDSATIWNKTRWQGIVDVAAAIEADLIVKVATVETRLQEVVHTPDDWNLIRHAQMPVMLLKADAWVREPVIVAAVNILDAEHEDLNLSILKQAAHLARVLGGKLHVVNAYPLFEPWAGELIPGYDYEQVCREVESEIESSIRRLADTHQVDIAMIHVRDGKPSMVLKDVIEASHAEMLVMGTAGRSGITGLVVGNTSEAILHLVNSDVVTLRS